MDSNVHNEAIPGLALASPFRIVQFLRSVSQPVVKLCLHLPHDVYGIIQKVAINIQHKILHLPVV